MTAARYPGRELELFAAAHNWKAYLARQVGPYLGRRVLEIGAGIGGTTRALAPGTDGEWWCVEPDARQAETLQRFIASGELPARCRVVAGTLRDVEPRGDFDSVLYIDVLEHLDDDAGEVAQAARRLTRGGYLVVVSPAHPWLFSAFDRAVGHHRRYVRGSLAVLAPEGLWPIRLRYLDSVGLLASAANRLLLRSDTPTRRQIALWDKGLVPLSTVVDRLVGYRLGKSVLAVWRRV